MRPLTTFSKLKSWATNYFSAISARFRKIFVGGLSTETTKGKRNAYCGISLRSVSHISLVP